MKKTTTLIILALLVFVCCSVEKTANPETLILESMKESEAAWNRGDLEGFMHNYWRSDSLKFIGKTSITYGWQQTLDRYIKGYPSPESKGTLTFEYKHLDQLGDAHYLQVGQYTLIRESDTLTGHFSLIWKLIDGEWLIIADHSS